MSGTSIPAWARPGVKCVCVNTGSVDGAPHSTGNWGVSGAPVEGAIYTIKKAFLDPDGEPTLHLVEIKRPASSIAYWGFEVGYHVARFRPAVSDSDELGIETILYRKAGLKSKASVRSVERA